MFRHPDSYLYFSEHERLSPTEQRRYNQGWKYVFLVQEDPEPDLHASIIITTAAAGARVL